MSNVTTIEAAQERRLQQRKEERRRLCAQDLAKEAQALLPIVSQKALQLSDSYKACRIMSQIVTALEMYNDLLDGAR